MFYHIASFKLSCKSLLCKLFLLSLLVLRHFDIITHWVFIVSLTIHIIASVRNIIYFYLMSSNHSYFLFKISLLIDMIFEKIISKVMMYLDLTALLEISGKMCFFYLNIVSRAVFYLVFIVSLDVYSDKCDNYHMLLFNVFPII